MEQEDIIKHMKNSDLDVDIGNGIMQHLKFIPTKDFYDRDVKLFGVKVRKQNRKLIVILKIYADDRREEIISKSGEMTRMVSNAVGDKDIDTIHIVDAKDVLEQMSKYKITGKSFPIDENQKITVVVEVIDLITGEMIPVEFNMGFMKIDNLKKVSLG